MQIDNLQPYKYNFGTDLSSLNYIEQDGKLVMSLFEIIKEDGKWIENSAFDTNFTITQYGESGCKVELDGGLDGALLGPDSNLILFFNSQIDWNQPLPLKEFSPSGSVFIVSSEIADPIRTPVTSLTRVYPELKTEP